MVRAELLSSCLWHMGGSCDSYTGLPPIPNLLATRLEAFERWHDDLDAANDLPQPLYWEQRTDFPVDAFNAEGRVIAHALKAALSANWTVVYVDVDAWLRPKDLPLEARQVILTPDPPAESA